MPLVKYIGDRRIKSTRKKPDGTVVVILDNGKNRRGVVRVFRTGEAYMKAVRVEEVR